MDLNLNEQQLQKVEQHLNDKVKKIGGMSCSVCENRNWKIFTKIFEISEFHSRSAMGKAPRIPVVSVMCVNCSNTLFFNAIELGIVSADKKEESFK